jgi:hypothetical protein
LGKYISPTPDLSSSWWDSSIPIPTLLFLIRRRRDGRKWHIVIISQSFPSTRPSQTTIGGIGTLLYFFYTLRYILRTKTRVLWLSSPLCPIAHPACSLCSWLSNWDLNFLTPSLTYLWIPRYFLHNSSASAWWLCQSRLWDPDPEWK